jgi:hypothetical protein
MSPNGIHATLRETTMMLYSGNIMTDEGRGGFLNTTMTKSNAEVASRAGVDCSW